MSFEQFLNDVSGFCYEKGYSYLRSKCIVVPKNELPEKLKNLKPITKEMILTGKPFYYVFDPENLYDKFILLVTLQFTAKIVDGYIRFIMINQDKTKRELYLTLADIELLTENAYEIPTIDETPLQYI